MKRILLKLSGEALAGKEKHGFDEETVLAIARQVKEIAADGLQIGIVIGGGNFWRGRTSENMNRSRADQIGMLATIMNCIYVCDAFRSLGMDTAVMTPFACSSFTELFSASRAISYLEEGKIVFFAGGTGHPYFSTDTATVLRAIEIEADSILLAKSIDGVYDADPAIHPEARKFDEISIDELIERGLMVVDMTASVLCRDNHMPMLVFGLEGDRCIVDALQGRFTGTRVTV